MPLSLFFGIKDFLKVPLSGYQCLGDLKYACTQFIKSPLRSRMDGN